MTAGLSLAVAGAAQAQVKPGSQSGLGLTGASIPPILQQDRADPYRMPAEPICASIDQEMAQLDSVIGPEVDKLKTDRSIADRAAGYVRGMIPYRGVVRFLTGADGKDRELQAAASAGYARRGFLHGLKAQNHCGAPETRVASADATGPAAALPAEAEAPAAPAEVRLAVAPSAEVHAADTSARVPDASAQAAGTEARLRPVAAATREPSPGERLSDQMLRGPAPAEPPQPANSHVVYQLVDVTTGRAIVPDGPAADPGGR